MLQFEDKFEFFCFEKKQPADFPVSCKCSSSPSGKECLRTSSQIEKSPRTEQLFNFSTGSEQLFHPIDNALTPRILNSASFSLSADDSPTIQEFCVFSKNVKQESLNKQLKCGSHTHDQISTGETRSVSRKLKWVALACWGKARWHGRGIFCGKKSRSQASALIVGGKTGQNTEGRVIDNRCRGMRRTPIIQIGLGFASLIRTSIIHPGGVGEAGVNICVGLTHLAHPLFTPIFN